MLLPAHALALMSLGQAEDHGVTQVSYVIQWMLMCWVWPHHI